MVNLVDQALRGPLFERAAGLASSDVTLADPAVGTGTFLLGALQAHRRQCRGGSGRGRRRPRDRRGRETAVRLRNAVRSVRGRAIAPARGNAGLDQGAKRRRRPNCNLFITDTLGNPFVEEEQLPQIVEAIAKSRREANRVKREQPITVVIGNPPYKEKAGRARRLDREGRRRQAARAARPLEAAARMGRRRARASI